MARALRGAHVKHGQDYRHGDLDITQRTRNRRLPTAAMLRLPGGLRRSADHQIELDPC